MGDDNFDVEKKETRRGRSAFVPSAEQRSAVMRMAAKRLGHPEIAAAIGISVPTLRKAFAIELKERLGEDNLFAAAGEPQPDQAEPPAKPRRRGAGGRKSFKPTERDREKVAVLIATGMTVEDIAKVMALSEPSLRKHFAGEIDTGALRRRAEILAAMHRNALRGNVSAQKEMLAIMDRATLEALQDQVRGKGKTETAAPTSTDAVGKKVQADLDAHSVVTKGPWADLVRVPPRAS